MMAKKTHYDPGKLNAKCSVNMWKIRDNDG